MTTSIAAKVVADSLSPGGVRLTTLQLTFPRIILAEFNTHRMFSRNAASSRAIPVKKMLEQVNNDPFVPKYWGKNQPGMQASEPLSAEGALTCESIWLEAAGRAVESVEAMIRLDLHKQLANRLLEPWMWTHVVVTATDWGNFLNQRIHQAAQPEMRELAEQVRDALQTSTPQPLSYGEWHLPYVSQRERATNVDINLRPLSVARCARVSYANHDGTAPNVEKDKELHDKLVESGHWSPLEHVATPTFHTNYDKNFRGWIQYRSYFAGENKTIYPGP